jgi:hypothetical protein
MMKIRAPSVDRRPHEADRSNMAMRLRAFGKAEQ